jgi:hypothetical protein
MPGWPATATVLNCRATWDGRPSAWLRPRSQGETLRTDYSEPRLTPSYVSEFERLRIGQRRMRFAARRLTGVGIRRDVGGVMGLSGRERGRDGTAPAGKAGRGATWWTRRGTPRPTRSVTTDRRDCRPSEGTSGPVSSVTRLRVGRGSGFAHHESCPFLKRACLGDTAHADHHRVDGPCQGRWTRLLPGRVVATTAAIVARKHPAWGHEVAHSGRLGAGAPPWTFRTPAHGSGPSAPPTDSRHHHITPRVMTLRTPARQRRSPR